MSRIVSVWLPQLPLERLKRETTARGATPPSDKTPFALVGSDTRGLSLTAVNARSLNEGLGPGMGLADARAICPRLLTAPAEPAKDAETLLALARWASRYSPRLAVDGDDGLWLDVTGVSHLFGGEGALLADLANRLAKAGFGARLGLAATLGAAHALARFGKRSPHIVPDGALHAHLAPLPVEALRLEPETAHLLRRLGLKRIGQLYGLPRASLARRFHSREAAQAVLLRLDQALGARNETRKPMLPTPDFVARLSFAEPLITHDGVMAGLDRLAAMLCEKLDRAGRGARRVALWAARTDGSAAAIEAGLSAPCRAPAHLVRLLKDRAEAIDMGFGVDLMALAALLTETLHPAQASLAPDEAAQAPEVLIDALANRLGPRAVRRLHPRASHIPERAQSLRSAFAGRPAWTDEAPDAPPRPLLLLVKPEPVSVLAEIPEGPPARFTWRRVSRRVVKAEGPERLAPEWWRQLSCRSQATVTIPPLDGEGGEAGGLAGWGAASLDSRASQSVPFSAPTPTLPSAASDLPARGRYEAAFGARPRDYYRVEDEDGGRYWLFREGLYQEGAEAPCWFLHGVFP